MSSLYRYAAFSLDAAGGNPAGIWIGDQLPDSDTMQRIAAEVGFSETAFVCPSAGANRTIRYYSPEAEVPFCGHATIATGVVLGELSGEGIYRLTTVVGDVPVAVTRDGNQWEASLTSVQPRSESANDGLVREALSALRWEFDDLYQNIPPARAYAGAWHLILAVATSSRLANLKYNFESLKKLMLREDLTTLQLIWRERSDLFHSRNPFPVGGVVEDPATGAAAAALGGYLRDKNLVVAPTVVSIRQGEMMGRPSLLTVTIPITGGIVVTGNAVALDV